MRMHFAWYLLLIAVPSAIVLHLLHAGPVGTFIAAAVGIIPLAALMGRATETLACHVGPHLGGLLSATFGNAAELILGLVALNRGLVVIVKSSIIGSIIGNTLLVLGMSLLVGGLRHRRQEFDRTLVGLQATLLVLAAIGLAVPTVLFEALGPQAEVNLSEEVATVFLITYALNVVFSLRRGERSGMEIIGRQTEAHRRSKRGLWLAAAMLAGLTLLVVIMSEVLVGAVEEARAQGLLTRFGMTELFLGVVVLAVIGNAAENSSAVLLAYRNQMDLSLHIAIGSSLQIALLVMPVLVFASLFLADVPLDLHFTRLELLAVLASVLVVHLVAADGQTHWMEGVLLLAVYLILALAFYHLPAAHTFHHDAH